VILWAVALVITAPSPAALGILDQFPRGSVFFWFAPANLSHQTADRLGRYVWTVYGILSAYTVLHRRAFLLSFAVLSLLVATNVAGCWVIFSGIHD
jgi:hypothetical protein